MWFLLVATLEIAEILPKLKQLIEKLNKKQTKKKGQVTNPDHFSISKRGFCRQHPHKSLFVELKVAPDQDFLIILWSFKFAKELELCELKTNLKFILQVMALQNRKQGKCTNPETRRLWQTLLKKWKPIYTTIFIDYVYGVPYVISPPKIQKSI